MYGFQKGSRGPGCRSAVGRWCTYVVEDVHPALHGDALEHGEHREQDVVKVGDAEVGARPVLLTLCTVGTRPGRGLLATRPISDLVTWQRGGGWEQGERDIYQKLKQKATKLSNKTILYMKPRKTEHIRKDNEMVWGFD